MSEESERAIRTDGGQVVHQKLQGVSKEEVRAASRRMVCG